MKTGLKYQKQCSPCLEKEEKYCLKLIQSLITLVVKVFTRIYNAINQSAVIVSSYKKKFYLTTKRNILFRLIFKLTLPWFSLVVATNGSSAKSRPKIRRSPADTTVELHDTIELQNKLIALIGDTKGIGKITYLTVKMAQYIPLKSWPLIFLLQDSTYPHK